MVNSALHHLDALSLRDLRALVTLADERHFGRAAEILGISQPSLSASIAKSESCLKTQIFERTSRRCNLTPTGQILIEQARLVLGELLRFAELSTPRQQPLTGRFRLGIIPTVAPYYLPHVVNDLLTQHPQLELILREELSDALIAQLRQGTIDAALLSLPLDLPGMVEFPILQEELALAVPAQHPLAAQTQATVGDARDNKMILLEHGHCLRDDTMELCEPERIDNPVQATSLETLRFMVKAGIGTAIVPAMAMHWELASGRDDGRIRYLPFEHPSPSRTLGLVTHHLSPLRADVEALAQFLGQMELREASVRLQ